MELISNSRFDVLRAADIVPIRIAAQVVESDRTGRLAVDVDAEGFAESLSGRCSLAQIPDRRSAAFREIGLFIGCQAVEVGDQLVHTDTLLFSNVEVNHSLVLREKVM